MSTSSPAIVNIALRRIGMQPIVSLDDDSEAARVASTFFTDVRDDILSCFPWNSATRRATLARLSVTPEYEFSYAHALPDDFLRLIDVEDGDGPYRIEVVLDGTTKRRAFVSDIEPFRIRYLARIEDVSLLDAKLQQAIGYRLSAELAKRLTGSESTAGQMWSLYTDALAEAKLQDAVQSYALDSLTPTALLGARMADPTRGGGVPWLPFN